MRQGGKGLGVGTEAGQRLSQKAQKVEPWRFQRGLVFSRAVYAPRLFCAFGLASALPLCLNPQALAPCLSASAFNPLPTPCPCRLILALYPLSPLPLAVCLLPFITPFAFPPASGFSPFAPASHPCPLSPFPLAPCRLTSALYHPFRFPPCLWLNASAHPFPPASGSAFYPLASELCPWLSASL